MSGVAISVENLAKRYYLTRGGHGQAKYTSLRDVLGLKAQALLRRTARILDSTPAEPQRAKDEFWALRDINFRIADGERVGIIGRNGAGKSTLLKILSRITEPTAGRVKIAGRVASLLEVGTGFHPELTGRENVFLNGAILGMSRPEIRRKFDEIVAFAEVERFLDTPVKHYSSGMYMRLAFSVAAHLDPDVLIVDEVLSVGDLAFQNKCMGALRDASTKEGKTVLFVSHNLSAVRALCTHSLLLSAGNVHFFGSTQEGLAQYAKLSEAEQLHRADDPTRPRILRVSVDEELACEGRLEVKVEFSSPWPLDPVLIGLVVANEQRSPVFGFNTSLDPHYSPVSTSAGVAVLRIDDLPIHSGTYTVDVYLGEKNENHDVVESATSFVFVSPLHLPNGISTAVIGSMRVNGRWSIEAGTRLEQPGRTK